MKKVKIYAALLLAVGSLSACRGYAPDIRGVGYQSLRTTQGTFNLDSIPKSARIIVRSYINENGNLDVFVYNNTDVVMTIDRTKTFFRDASGKSVAYYDPTVRTQSTSTTIGQTSTAGAGVNLGSVAGALGVGGVLGQALNGVNVGGSRGQNTSTTNVNTTYDIDLPQVSIAPHGEISLGRIFNITGIGFDFLEEAIITSTHDVHNTFLQNHSYASNAVFVSYSFDDGKTYEQLETDVYANSIHIGRVDIAGRVNRALRKIYLKKDDALQESWYLLYIPNFGNGEKCEIKKNGIIATFK